MSFVGRGSVTLVVTTTSSRVALPSRTVANLAGNSIPILHSSKLRLIVDPGTFAADDNIFIAFGDANVVATQLNGVPIIPGLVETYALKPDDTHIAAISTANSGVLQATIGSEKH